MIHITYIQKQKNNVVLTANLIRYMAKANWSEFNCPVLLISHKFLNKQTNSLFKTSKYIIDNF